jgi:hypothetical protein
MKVALAFLSMAAAFAQEAPEFKQENTAENLKAYFETLLTAISTRKEKIAVAMTRSLFPDEARLKKAVKDDVDKEFLAKVVAWNVEALKVEDSKQVTVFYPGNDKRTEVQVHGATTEDLLKYEKDSVAYKEFPGGAKRLAETVMRAGVKFHEVEIVEPGKDSGMKYHLFYWDGEKWTMLGPAWRQLPK